jgi:hypothetical protein
VGIKNQFNLKFVLSPSRDDQEGEKAIKGIKYFSYEKETLKWNISGISDEKGKFSLLLPTTECQMEFKALLSLQRQ